MAGADLAMVQGFTRLRFERTPAEIRRFEAGRRRREVRLAERVRTDAAPAEPEPPRSTS